MGSLVDIPQLRHFYVLAWASSSSSGSFSASIETQGFQPNAIQTFEIATETDSVATLELIGFLPDVATEIYERHLNRPDPDMNLDDYPVCLPSSGTLRLSTLFGLLCLVTLLFLAVLSLVRSITLLGLATLEYTSPPLFGMPTSGPGSLLM